MTSRLKLSLQLTATGHVCRACRRQLLASYQYRRHQSTVTEQITHGSGSDTNAVIASQKPHKPRTSVQSQIANGNAGKNPSLATKAGLEQTTAEAKPVPKTASDTRKKLSPTQARNARHARAKARAAKAAKLKVSSEAGAKSDITTSSNEASETKETQTPSIAVNSSKSQGSSDEPSAEGPVEAEQALGNADPKRKSIRKYKVKTSEDSETATHRAVRRNTRASPKSKRKPAFRKVNVAPTPLPVRRHVVGAPQNSSTTRGSRGHAAPREKLHEIIRLEDEKKSAARKEIHQLTRNADLIAKHDVSARTLKVNQLLAGRQPPIPPVEYGLDRVLFNPGVHFLQDPHSQVYNFDTYLQHVMPVKEFDYTQLKEYKTSSKDEILTALAKKHGRKYVGSTSSMTSILAHFHFLLSQWRDINLSMLSRGFDESLATFTQLSRGPQSVFLRWKDGTYAIDADKDCNSPNILMMLGKSMEKLLTLPKDKFERYRKSDHRNIPQDEREAPEAYQYTVMGDFLMRSQLDARDPRLPGRGTFDLKTRAVVTIRMSAIDYEPMLGYELLSLQGQYNSYEREFYDMLRSTMLKYSLQARMGKMDGIFVAYHNIERVFGFQYLPMHEIDLALHGQTNPTLGDQEFSLSLRMLNDILNIVTNRYPEQSVRLVFEMKISALRIYAVPMTEEEIEATQAPADARFDAYEKELAAEVDLSDLISEVDTATDPADASVDHAPVARDELTDGVSSEGDAPLPLEQQSAATPDDGVESGSLPVDESMEAVREAMAPDPSLNVHADKDILSLVVTVNQKVNGEPVVRPESLGPSDVWKVKYTIHESKSDKFAKDSYAAAVRWRSILLKNPNAEDISGADVDTVTKKMEEEFIAMMKAKAKEGREMRRKQDLRDANKKVQMLRS